MSGSKDVVLYRLQQSETALKIAVVVGDAGEWGHASNRLYYAVFYAVSAYLASIGDAVKTHNGAKTKFHNIFVKNKLVDQKSGSLYDILFSNRQDADYSDFAVFTKDQVFPLIDETKALVDTIKSFIKIE